MPLPGEVVNFYYDSARLGPSSSTPELTVGYFDGAAFVEVLAAAAMIELESPALTPTAIFAKEFTVPAPPDFFGTWLGIVKVNISAVDRWFGFPFEVAKSEGQLPLSSFASGSDLSLFGPWLAQQIRSIRKVTDRIIISQALLEQFSRDRTIALISSASAKTGEDATFTFTVIDVETGLPLNVEGADIRFLGEDAVSSASAWDVAGSVIDGEQGRVEATVGAAITAILTGQFNSELVITLPDLTVKKSQTFLITIDPSLSPP